MRISLIGTIAAGALALGGCAYGYGDYGLGYGYNDYGYGSPYYGYGYNYGPYGGYGAYPGYYGGFGYPYYGWYDDSYYPGTGIYVYDSYRRPRVWSDRERTYWTSRQKAATTTTTTSGTRNTRLTQNWSGFSQRHPHP